MRNLKHTVFLLLGVGLFSTALLSSEIHDAARAGDLAKVKALIEKDPGLVKALDNMKAAPLHHAAGDGRTETAAYLIERGAEIDQKDVQGRTPLWWAAAGAATVDTAGLLVDRGADINAVDRDNWTALMQAAFRGRKAMVDLLLDKGATLPDSADQRMAMLETFASRGGLIKLMDRIVAAGADLMWHSDARGSLLHQAAAGGSPEIIDRLIKAGLPGQEPDIYGWTPLHYAAEKGRKAAAEMLLSRGAEINARTVDGKTAYNLAREWKQNEVVELLTAKGADRSEPKFPVLTGPYLGQKPPGKTPEPFAVGLIASRYAFHGGICFSPDGREACWSVQEYGKGMASLETKLVGGRWTLPRLASFAEIGRGDDVPFVSPDGKRLFFVSRRPVDKGRKAEKENIWVMDRKANGWSEPMPLPPVVNSLSLHWQVSVDAQGNLYFGGAEEGSGYGQMDIYGAKYENGKYGKPENLGPAVNGPGFEHSPFIAPDGSYLLFSKMDPQAGVDCLHISFRKPDGTWTKGRELNSVIKYNTRSMCPWVTPDGKYLFFGGVIAMENEPFWVEAGFIEELRKTELLPSAAALITEALEKKGLAAAEEKFKELRARADQYKFDERELNALGYRLLRGGKGPEAVAVFLMNTIAFPESWNAWDSLAEASAMNGDSDKAETFYSRSLALNPKNVNARDALSQLRGYKLDAQGETKAAPRFKPGEKTGVAGPYFGQEPPGLQPRVFAPGIVSTSGNFEFSITFNPDGKEVYFTRRTDSGGRNTMMVSRWEQDGWTAPQEAGFCKGYPANEPCITPDGKKLYFGCWRQQPGAKQVDYGIWVTERTAAGAWGAPRYHGVGMYVSAGRTGNLYMNDIANSAGGGIVRYPASGATLGQPEKLGGGVNAPRDGAHAFIAPDESFIVFDSYQRPGGQGGEGDLWVAFKKADGAWTEAFNLGDVVNTPATNFCPSLSPDGKYLFFSTCRDIYWVSSEVISRLRPKTEGDKAAPYDPQTKFPVEALKEDLKILWDVLDEGHAGLDRYTPRDELKKIFDRARDAITAPLTELDFYVKLLPLVAEIKDGHTRLSLSAAAGAFLDAQPVFFPFGLRFLGGKAYIFRNLSSAPDVKEGAELLAVNGTSVEKILPELLALIPNDAGIPTRKLRQLQFPENFGRLLALRFGLPEAHTLRFRPYRGREVKDITVPGIKGTDVVPTLYKRYPDAARKTPLYELSFRGATAVLTIRGFVDDEEKGRPPYPKFLKDAFGFIAHNKSSNLVIDLRGNGGGQDDYGKLLFAYVADKPFMYYKALESKKDHYDLFKYTNISKAEVEELSSQVRKNERGWYDVLGHPNRGLQQPQEPHFAGRVAILIDGLSYSATGETTSLFHYHRQAVFFGEECGAGYYGNTSGFMVMVTLPNSGIQLRLPLIAYSMAVDGYPRDRGIVPEVPVAPTIDDLLTGRDPAMDRALKFLNDNESAARLTSGEAQELMDAHAQDAHFAVLDVRTPDEFAGGHLPNAVNIDIKAPDLADRLEKLDKNGVYLVYCRGGVRSLRAMSLMKDKGFKRVYDLEGGILKWQDAGLPVIPEGKKSPSAAERTKTNGEAEVCP